ncbi:hypothetical protein [Zunongwangia sp.]|uniref:hypothetical protein n=1 Tax=Zunongwangia sp. TaxID=1965325 RepID=UPI003AA9409F
MKRIYFIAFFLISAITFGQKTVNNYKYVIVPKKFEFLKEDNQYQVNALTKFLLDKYGFETYMKSDEKPADLSSNPCLALTADLENESGLFVTKLIFKLEDCYGNVVFESKEGRSREKNYKTAYHEAIRDAFTSVKELDYNYQQDPQIASAPKTQEPAISNTVSTEVKEKVTKNNKQVAQPANQDKKAIVDRVFLNSGKRYVVKENPKGFGLYQENAPEPFAILIASRGSGNFIYNSLTKQGIAYFDENGNLMVEIFNQQTGNTDKTTYQVAP